jgi:hypothetical protein
LSIYRGYNSSGRLTEKRGDTLRVTTEDFERFHVQSRFYHFQQFVHTGDSPRVQRFY